MSVHTLAETGGYQKKVTLGEVFNITLPGNETTGYTWTLAEMPHCLVCLNMNYQVDSNPPGLVGAPGKKTFTFKAMAASKGEKLVFKEMRPWMFDFIDEQSWTIMVDGKIRYERYTDYFAKSKSKAAEYLVVTTYDGFDQYFGPAAVMGQKQKWIEKADFNANLVVATIFPVKQVLTETTIEKVEVANKTLTVAYTTKETPITWSAQCYLLLLVEKGSYQSVIFKENGVTKKTVPVK